MQIRAGLFWLFTALLAPAGGAAALERSIFPMARPGATPLTHQARPARELARDPALAALAPHTSLRPAARPTHLATRPAQPAAQPSASRDAGFDRRRAREKLDRWCGRRDSNPHDFRRWYLKPVRLPIPPRPPADSAAREQTQRGHRQAAGLYAFRPGHAAKK